MSVIFNNIEVSINEHQILQGINGTINRGQFVSLMGPSGSGKTTLINILSGRFNDYKGSLLVERRHPKYISREIGFVLQDDLLFPNLTVADTLYYAAELRCPHLDKVTRKQKIKDVVSLLHLEKVLEYQIGDYNNKILSGGEKRRVTIAVELISSPSILFLDEPTSGLDTASAVDLLDNLKILSNQGITIICAIHQPPAQTYYLFDQLIFLVDGRIIYRGRPAHIKKHFKKQKFNYEALMNPADYIMHKLHALDNDSEKLKMHLINSWKSFDGNTNLPNEDAFPDVIKNRNRLPFFKQFSFLFRRSMTRMRKTIFDWVDLIGTAIILIYLGLIWYQKINSSLDGSLHAIIIYSLIAFLALYRPGYWSIFTFLIDKPIIKNELGNGSYSLLSYYLAQSVADFPFIVIHPTIILIVLYFVFGFPLIFDYYFYLYAIIITHAYTINAIGLIISAIRDNVETTTQILDHVLNIIALSSGLWSRELPMWIRWLQYLSPMACAYEGLHANHYQYKKLNITDDAGITYWFTNKWSYFVLLLAWSIFYRIIGYISIMRVLSNKSKVSCSRPKSKILEGV